MRVVFSDLDFHDSKTIPNTKEANLLLKNGYTVHVLKGAGAASTYGAPYELSATPVPMQLFEDSVGYLNKSQVEQLCNEIQNLQTLKYVKS